MPAGIVQSIETHAQVRQKTLESLPPRGWFELSRIRQGGVFAVLRVAWITQQPPCDGLKRNEILIVGGPCDQLIAVGQCRARITNAEQRGDQQRPSCRIGGHCLHGALSQSEGSRRIEL